MDRLRAGSLFRLSNPAKAVADTLDESSHWISRLYGSIMAFPHTVVPRTTSVLGFDILVDPLHTQVLCGGKVALETLSEETAEPKDNTAVVRSKRLGI